MDSLGTWETEVYEIGPGQVRGMAFDLEDRRLALSDEDKISILDLDSGAGRLLRSLYDRRSHADHDLAPVPTGGSSSH